VSDVTPEDVLEDVKRFNPKVLRTSLSKEDEAKLHKTFDLEEE